ncbi:ceramide-1-phosphate transfer protein-like [Ptychodera flava]|uniref:ceramide-1-phosphate transfer protein-like n=1 Tax=Ptychodera flava TaxID=63121 RepID=UPI003969E6A3
MATTDGKPQGNANGLDLEFVIKSFEEAHPEKDKVIMDHYLVGYAEITRFFEVMGSLFGFVVKDMKEKMGILHKHKESNYKENFQTIQSMIAYELEEKLTDVKSPDGLPSGSRTLLRLHRSLEFIAELLRSIKESESDAKVSSLASTVYSETLAKHHPWLIRKAAGLAMYTLPSRKQFMETSFKLPAEEAEKVLPDFLKVTKSIYDEIQELYAKHNLLNLP